MDSGPRRTNNTTYPTTRNSPQPPESAPVPLSPPRPRFLAQDSRRSSGTASDSSGSELENKEHHYPVPRAKYARRRSAMANTYTSVAPTSPITSPISPSFSRRRHSNPFESHEATYPTNEVYAPVPGSEDYDLSPSGSWTPNQLYNEADDPLTMNRGRRDSRPPPSSFQYPFQSHPGNPDPLPRRRSGSLESRNSDHQRGFSDNLYNQQAISEGSHHQAFSEASHDLPQPSAPFMSGRRSHSSSSISAMAANNAVYRSSAAAGMMSPSQSQAGLAYDAPNGGYPHSGTLPRMASQPNFRAPFLSPASRPGSALSGWRAPTYPYAGPASASGSALALPAPPAPAPSTRLANKLTKEEKPWMLSAAPRARISWWLTFVCMLIGVGGAGVICFFGFQGVDRFTSGQLCSVMQDNFETFDLQNTWTRDVQLGGFGNAEFQMATAFDNNSYVQNGNLYIMPTLSADALGEDMVRSGTYTMNPCTEALTNKTACTAKANGVDQIVNPVMAARIHTRDHYSITYGRVEVRAKLPRGDWLWPAIWMLPVNGTWPLNGEIDIMEARGNSPAYEAQGSNFVRSTVQYGPFAALVARTWGWYGLKRTSFDKDFHTYGFEWDQKWMRFYVDSQIHRVLEITTKNKKSSFWNRAGFPDTATNGSAEVVVQNPYQHDNSPFDQPFYLIINLAIGGTSGWFPDKVGNKPWFDGSLTAMNDFYKAKNSWYPTWAKNPQDGAFRIDSVKMWRKC